MNSNPSNVSNASSGAGGDSGASGDSGAGGRGLSALGELFLPVYHRVYDAENDRVIRTRTRLAAARIDTNAEIWIARNIAYGVITGGVLAVLALTLGTLFFTLTGIEFETVLGIRAPTSETAELMRALQIPAVITVTSLIAGITGFVTGFQTPFTLLKLETDTRKREIDRLLPDTVSYMYALSVGGMNQLEIMENVADSTDVYGATSEEFQTILQTTTYFDVDYRTAIQQRAEETPSESFSEFLTDLLSVISSGGDLTEFLDDSTDKYLREAQTDQEDTVNMLELFGEMYLNMSLLPILLIVVLTIMELAGSGIPYALPVLVYVLIPLLGFTFLILMSTILPDKIGDGILEHSHDNENGDTKPGTGTGTDSVFDVTLTEQYRDTSTPVFDTVYKRETMYKLREAVTNPFAVFITHPWTTFTVSIPATIIIMLGFNSLGMIPTTIDGVTASPWGTIVLAYIPLYVLLTPYTIAQYTHRRQRNQVVDTYTETLRKLSSANDTGLTLQEAFVTVANSSQGRIRDELREINAKTQYQHSLGDALREFNNKYTSPTLARINNLIIDAQETSSQISNVLATAAKTSENQDKLKRKRESATQMQVIIMIMAFVILMGVMAGMQHAFIDTMAGVGGDVAADADDAPGGVGGGLDTASIDPDVTGTLFFHAVTIQAITTGLLASYLKSNTVRNAGVYIIPLLTVSLAVFVVVL